MYIFDTEEVANDYFKLEEDSWKKLYIDFLFDNILEDNGNTYLGSSGLVQNNKNYFLGMSQVMACRSYLCKINGAV